MVLLMVHAFVKLYPTVLFFYSTWLDQKKYITAFCLISSTSIFLKWLFRLSSGFN